MGSRATRDLGLARIGRLTRWMAAGAVVAGGVLSAAVAQALPGHSSHAAGSVSTGATLAPGSSAGSQTPATGVPTGAADPTAGGSAGDAGQGLSAPVQAPQPVQAQPVVNSGGS